MDRDKLLKNKILVVEDDDGLRQLIKEELLDEGFHVIDTDSAESACEIILVEAPDLVISDLRLPGMDGLALFDRSRTSDTPPAFILITAFGTVEQAVDALQKGADDFLTKPLNLDHLRLTVKRAIERKQLQQEINRYREVLNKDDFYGLVGHSKPMLSLYEQIRRVAKASGPILITGESGVGKELVARAIHSESDRAAGHFVAVNCAGIPSELLESELFGHAAGAFTGAQRARKGLFAEANGGTIMLDEIGEMPIAMQSKLLRILQDGYVRPVGEDKEKQINARIIAATNCDLETEIEKNTFRKDLFYRLETFSLTIPALRFRGDDIDLLVAHFIARFATVENKQVVTITSDAMDALRQYPFPGNVRELSNAIERAIAFAKDEVVQREDLPGRIRNYSTQQKLEMSDALMNRMLSSDELPNLREMETRYVEHVLQLTEGNKRRAAELLGIGRRTLYRYMEQNEAGHDKC